MSAPAATGNFLTRLASQARGDAPALAPRLPALFESVPQAMVPPIDAGVVVPRGRSPGAADDHDGGVPPRDDGIAAMARGTVSVRRSRQVQPAAAPDAEEGARPFVPVAAEVPALARHRAGPEPDPMHVVVSPAAAGDAAPARGIDADAPARAVDRRAQRTAIEGMLQPDRSLKHIPRATPAATSPWATPAAEVAGRARPAPAADAGMRRPPVAGGRVAEPVIRVSIDRIEVRAVAATPTAGKPARARPIRLDDYLQQRGRTR